MSSSKTPRSLGDLLQRYNVDPRRYAEGGTVVDQYGRKLTRANYEGKVDRQGIPDDDDDPFNYNPNAQRYTNYKDELFLSPARNVLDESFRQKLSAQDPTGELKLIEKAYSAMPRDQFGDVFDQLNARDAWKVNQAAMGAHESPWVLNPENRMMAVGIADDVTGTPSVLLYDPTQRVGSFINPGFSTWTSSGDPETDFQQALNMVPYQQYAMMNKIGAWDRNYDEPLDPLKGAGPGMYSDADHEKIRKGLEDLSTPLPALDYQFLPRGYFNPTELSGSYAQKRANPEARAPFDLYKEFLNLNPVDNLLPKLPSLPSLSLKSKPGYAAGGAVNYNPSEIDTIVSEFREAFHG